MSELDGTRTISIPSLAFNYVDNKLESIGYQGELYVRQRALGCWECETCHGESDLSEWVCSECQCWIPLGLTPENIGRASEWRYCPHCGRKVKEVKR